jgi:SAM-dependent methyltransferase
MSRSYWRGAAEDVAMQDEHGFIWKAMLDTIDTDLAGSRVLDAGCNRGGFLRLLVDTAGIAEGYGYDPAFGAITDARRLAADRPLTFEVADTVPTEWGTSMWPSATRSSTWSRISPRTQLVSLAL